MQLIIQRLVTVTYYDFQANCLDGSPPASPTSGSDLPFGKHLDVLIETSPTVGNTPHSIAAIRAKKANAKEAKKLAKVKAVTSALVCMLIPPPEVQRRMQQRLCNSLYELATRFQI